RRTNRDDEAPARPQREPRAVGDDAAMGLRDRRPHRAKIRLRRPVDVEQTRLPAVEIAFVDRMEEEQAAHVRLAEGELDRLAVVRALHCFWHRLNRYRLPSRVEARLRRRDLRFDTD